jgi:hypothetical protein
MLSRMAPWDLALLAALTTLNMTVIEIASGRIIALARCAVEAG